MKRLFISLILCLIGFTAVAQVSAPWTGAEGNGTLVSPWLIKTAAQLNALATSVNGSPGTPGKDYAGCYFALAAEIGTSSASSDITTIGTDLNSPFRGCLDGRGYNLYIKVKTTATGGYALAGLFGYLGNGAVITNVNVAGGSTITATGATAADRLFAAAIAAVVENGATVRNCAAAATVTCAGKAADVLAKTAYVGNLVAFNRGRVVNCVASGTVKPSATHVTDGNVHIGTGISYNGSVAELFLLPCSVTGKVSLPTGKTGDITVTIQDATGKSISTKTGASPLQYTLDKIAAWIDEVYSLVISAGGYNTQTLTSSFTAAKPDVTLGDVTLEEVSYGWYIPTANGGTYDGGIYHISNRSELLALANIVNGTVADDVQLGSATCPFGFAGDTIQLDNNIDLDGLNWVPVGYNGSDAFAGNFDGNNKTISNLKIHSDKYNLCGLFGAVMGGSVKQLTLSGVDIKNTNETPMGGDFGVLTGAVVGMGMGMGMLSDIHLTCVVSVSTETTVPAHSGGLIGYAFGVLVANCSVTPDDAEAGHIKATGKVVDAGGLVGVGVGTFVSNCFSSAIVNVTDNAANIPSKSSNIGGILGKSASAGVYNSYASGDITVSAPNGSVYNVGGIGGDGNITNCYALGSSITATGGNPDGNKVGRIAGIGSILNSYANKDMKGTFDGENGTDMAATASPDWWNPKSDSTILAMLNEYVTVNPEVSMKNDMTGETLTATLAPWRAGGSLTMPASLMPRYNVTGKVDGGAITTTITAVKDGDVMAESTCNSDGTFQMLLPDGEYTINVETTDGKEATTTVTVSGKDVKITTPITLVSSYAWYTEHTGDGAYLISTPGQLRALANIVNGTAPAGVEWNGKAHPFNFYQKTLQLTADINLAGLNWVPIGKVLDMEGIGDPSTIKSFAGNFDGNNKTISNLKIHSDEYNYCGLFGAVMFGSVKQLTLLGVDIKNTRNIAEDESVGVCTGAVAGVSLGVLSDIHVSGAVSVSTETTVTANSGGLVGMGAACLVVNCEMNPTNTGNHITVTGYQTKVGGVLGFGEGANIFNCFSTANIDATNIVSASESNLSSCVGGIIGYYVDGSINNSYASGTLSVAAPEGYAYFVGGIGGAGDGDIANCYALGSSITATGGTSGDNKVARIVAYGSLSASYANAAMTLNGAAVSSDDATSANGKDMTAIASPDWWKPDGTNTILAMLNTYVKANPEVSIQSMTGETLTATLAPWAGGGTSQNVPVSFAPRYSVTGSVTGGTATTTLTAVKDGDVMAESTCNSDGTFQMLLPDGTYTINVETADGKEATTTVTVSGKDVAISGTITLVSSYAWYTEHTGDGAYLISTPGQLRALSCITNQTAPADVEWNGKAYPFNFAGATLQLAADIDLAGIDWEPIGYYWFETPVYFSGTFDGNGKTISNLKVRDVKVDSKLKYGYVGLFGQVVNGTVRNLTLRHVSLYGSSAKGVIGAVAGRITDSMFSDISLCGNVSIDATDSFGYISTNICNVGGLVGEANSSLIANCSIVPVPLLNGKAAHITTGCTQSLGGITGSTNSSTIANCFSTAVLYGSPYSSMSLGGVVGDSYSGRILNCYASGDIFFESLSSSSISTANIGGIAGRIDATTVSSCYALMAKVKQEGNKTNAGDKIGRIVGLVEAGAAPTACYANSAMEYINKDGGKPGFNSENGTSMTALAASPWWQPGGATLTEMLNNIVSANWKMQVGGFSTTLHFWTEGESQMMPAGFAAGVSGYYQVSGTVSKGEDEDGGTIALTITRKGETSPLSSGYCVADGSFALMLKPGTYTIQVTREDGGVKEVDATVSNANINLGTITPAIPITDGYEWYVPTANGGEYASGNYQIKTAAGLRAFAHIVNGTIPDSVKLGGFSKPYGVRFDGKTVQLTANIDLESVASEPIGKEANKGFNGTFDGNNKTISNLKVSTISDFLNYGLFGYVDGATIKNITLVNANIDGAGSGMFDIVTGGGIVGEAARTSLIVNCAVINEGTDKKIKLSGEGQSFAGGIVGILKGTVLNCYSNIYVESRAYDGDPYAGGIAGQVTGTVANCYASNTVDANEMTRTPYAGGIVGKLASGTVTHSYALVSAISLSSPYSKYAGKIVANPSNATSTACYANSAMTIPSGATINPTGTDMTALAVSPWWKPDDNRSITEMLNAYTAPEGVAVTLRKWTANDSKDMPSVFE